MRLTVLGSGSRGNAVVIESGGASLLVDAGFSFRELCARCETAGVATERLVAIAVTHEHGDHARGTATAVARWGVPLVASRGTIAALEADLPADARLIPLEPSRPAAASGFTIVGFPTSHDASEPMALVVNSPEGRSVAVVLDAGSPTVALRHAMRGRDAVVIEANHDEVMLRACRYPPTVRARIAGRGGHLSNRQAAELVAEAAHSGLSLIVLAHLSDECNRPRLAEAAVRSALSRTAFKGRLVVASQDEPSPCYEVGAATSQLQFPLAAAH